MIKVTSEVDIYELNGKKTQPKVGVESKSLLVKSHWNESGKIVLEYGGETITVVASDLIVAVYNAKNTVRFR